MDGVPGLSFDGIAPGTHVHLSLQGEPVRHVLVPLAFALPGAGRACTAPSSSSGAAANATRADREHVLLLSDWTDHDPEHIYATLKRQSDYYNFGKRTVGDFLRRRAQAGLVAPPRPTGACGARCA